MAFCLVIEHYLCVVIGDIAAQQNSRFSKLPSFEFAVRAVQRAKKVLRCTQDFHNRVQKMVDEVPTWL